MLWPHQLNTWIIINNVIHLAEDLQHTFLPATTSTSQTSIHIDPSNFQVLDQLVCQDLLHLDWFNIQCQVQQPIRYNHVWLDLWKWSFIHIWFRILTNHIKVTVFNVCVRPFFKKSGHNNYVHMWCLCCHHFQEIIVRVLRIFMEVHDWLHYYHKHQLLLGAHG